MQTQTDKPQRQYSATEIITNKLKDSNKPIYLIKGLTYKAIVEAYLENNGIGWSLKTQESEAARLRTIIPILEEFKFNAHSIYLKLVENKLAPYTIRTIFARLKNLINFCIRNKLVTGDINPFYNYMKFDAPNKFKVSSVYKPAVVVITHSALINKINMDPEFTEIERETLKYLLNTGLRISELYKVEEISSGKWHVKGKGGKFRRVLLQPPTEILSKDLIRKSLSRYSLTPHDLRRLFATELANKGLTGNQLKQIMGWSSIQTANYYLQNTEDELLLNDINKLMQQKED